MAVSLSQQKTSQKVCCSQKGSFLGMRTHFHLYKSPIVQLLLKGFFPEYSLSSDTRGWDFSAHWCWADYKSLCRISEFSRIGPDCTTASAASLVVGMIQLRCCPLPSLAPGECHRSCALTHPKPTFLNRKRAIPGSSMSKGLCSAPGLSEKPWQFTGYMESACLCIWKVT